MGIEHSQPSVAFYRRLVPPKPVLSCRLLLGAGELLDPEEYVSALESLVCGRTGNGGGRVIGSRVEARGKSLGYVRERVGGMDSGAGAL